MPKLMQDGDWRIVLLYGRHKIMHYCASSVYSWEKWHMKKSWAAVITTKGSGSRTFQGCRACDAIPPVEMQGMINLLEWER